jgi:hypothetical protein
LKKPSDFHFKGQAVPADQPVAEVWHRADSGGWRHWLTIQGGGVVEVNMRFDKA